MTVKDLKKALEPLDDNLEVIVMDCGSSDEFKTSSVTTIADDFLLENPGFKKECYINI